MLAFGPIVSTVYGSPGPEWAARLSWVRLSDHGPHTSQSFTNGKRGNARKMEVRSRVNLRVWSCLPWTISLMHTNARYVYACQVSAVPRPRNEWCLLTLQYKLLPNHGWYRAISGSCPPQFITMRCPLQAWLMLELMPRCTPVAGFMDSWTFQRIFRGSHSSTLDDPSEQGMIFVSSYLYHCFSSLSERSSSGKLFPFCVEKSSTEKSILTGIEVTFTWNK